MIKKQIAIALAISVTIGSSAISTPLAPTQTVLAAENQVKSSQSPTTLNPLGSKQSANNSCVTGTKTKVWWDGIELKPGQIGRLMIKQNTPLYALRDGEKVFSRTLKAGEKYRIYTFKDDKVGVGAGLYVDRDNKITYQTPSKSKLALVNCVLDSNTANKSDDSFKQGGNPIKSTWLWDTTQIKENSPDIFKFLKENNVNSVYLQVNSDVSTVYYQRFIQEASDKGILVFALGGSPEWLVTNNLKKNAPEDFNLWLKEYQRISKKNQQFAGIHLDVEPYLLTDWEHDYQNVVKKYQDILMKAKQYSNDLNITFEVDIPFWFDNQHFDNEIYGRGLLIDWIIDHVDGVTIMAYRNSINGPNGIKELSSYEINYANTVGKKVTIGIETQPLPESYLTFYEKGRNTMEQSILELFHIYDEEESFQGIAIHSYESWKLLKP